MLSFFMVNHLPTWNEMHPHGNPTKSSIVNDLISFVKKKEMHDKWNESKTDCAVEHSEFQNVLDAFHHASQEDFNCKYH